MGRNVTTPSEILLNSDKLELISAEFAWGSDPGENTCSVTYEVWNSGRTEKVRIITYVISGSDFATLVSGYGGTMESNLESSIWQDIQSRFGLVP